MPKSAIEIISESKIVNADTKEEVAVYSLRIDKDAPCLRLTASTAGLLLKQASITCIDDRELFRTKRAKITFQANGEGQLIYGNKNIGCLGSPTVKYTQDLTIQGIVGTDKFLRKFSDEYQVWMEFAVLIMGQRGIYIHEGAPTLEENGGEPSAGCIHLGEGDAKDFYDWVTGRTRILISYPW